ncbi:glyoxalase [Knoellia flava TL1]|uniref:Glyoxalase n=2 Tax=Knoellia flava TaxID=913969 RepID=A0A8H9KQF1_9MICO|nr:VOC family protein [Knoellia flava]KGN30110.1 glyoxalase [Knoellia flava TL1]GGB72621.1 glyoxalase [Knoellia flava]
MTSRISHTSVDSRDAHAQSHWWSEVLGWSEDPQDPNLPGHEECMIFSPDGRERLLFIEVPEGKTVKNRLHLDLTPTDRTRDEEVERLLAHGATVHQDLRDLPGRPAGSGWVTLLDPEGNEFCILRSESERPDPYAHLVV